MTARALLLLIPTILVGCGASTGLDPTDPTGDDPLASAQPIERDGAGEIELDFGDAVSVAGTPLQIGFATVDSDSRCPEDVTCVWAGDIEIGLVVAVGDGDAGQAHTLHLNTEVGPNFADVDGYRIELVDVGPAAMSTSTPAASDYSIRLKITEN